MKFILFADDEVGLATAQVFRDHGQSPDCLVLDERDRKGLNVRIIEDAGVASDRILYANELNSPSRLQWLAAQGLDLGILAWWPLIITSDVLSLPRLGCLNFHPSLLPHNRGKDPNFWTLKNETPAGVSIHFVDAGIDTGDIVFQAAIDTTWEDTGETLYIKSKQALVRLFAENFARILSGDLPRRAQNSQGSSFHKRRDLEPASQIDLNASYRARDLLNLLRGRTFAPHPAAWFVDRDERYEVRVSISKVSCK